MEFETAIQGLKSNSCPNCHNSIDYDVQADSIYCNCSCGGFEVSTFRDKFNGSLILFYLNNEDTGGVDQKNLKELQEGLSLDVDRILLDNMTISEMREAVNIANAKIYACLLWGP